MKVMDLLVAGIVLLSSFAYADIDLSANDWSQGNLIALLKRSCHPLWQRGVRGYLRNVVKGKGKEK